MFHSIVMQYLAEEERDRIRSLLVEAGDGADSDAPVAWLRMEPAGERTEVRLTVWPPGHERLVATAGYHGADIRTIDRA